jgi:hypothetical protein
MSVGDEGYSVFGTEVQSLVIIVTYPNLSPGGRLTISDFCVLHDEVQAQYHHRNIPNGTLATH